MGPIARYYLLQRMMRIAHAYPVVEETSSPLNRSAEDLDASLTMGERAALRKAVSELNAQSATDDPAAFYGRNCCSPVSPGSRMRRQPLQAFGMPGLRLGWLIAPPTLTPQLRQRHEYATEHHLRSTYGQEPAQLAAALEKASHVLKELSA
ncbi:hypothetical protein [Streptomyces sp. 11x1]|uniref:hypothetical protein n=1 Tax=Streptomyces sp. 11x1 TaxID=3038642 RepID=UPI00292FCFE5|nr:hypothetical protein [Streptomyces sp. 11x1]WNZ06557.1 hypothetical protein P8T65_02440 [Streptomyces sp. 11x1]